MKRSLHSATLLSIILLPAVGGAQAEGMQRGPHSDGHRSIGFQSNHGWAPGTTCPAG